MLSIPLAAHPVRPPLVVGPRSTFAVEIVTRSPVGRRAHPRRSTPDRRRARRAHRGAARLRPRTSRTAEPRAVHRQGSCASSPCRSWAGGAAHRAPAPSPSSRTTRRTDSARRDRDREPPGDQPGPHPARSGAHGDHRRDGRRQDHAPDRARPPARWQGRLRTRAHRCRPGSRRRALRPRPGSAVAEHVEDAGGALDDDGSLVVLHDHLGAVARTPRRPQRAAERPCRPRRRAGHGARAERPELRLRIPRAASATRSTPSPGRLTPARSTTTRCGPSGAPSSRRSTGSPPSATTGHARRRPLRLGLAEVERVDPQPHEDTEPMPRSRG